MQPTIPGRILLTLAAALALHAAPTQAQAPPLPPVPFAYERMQVLAALDLTPAQTLQVLDIVADAAELRVDIQAGVDAALAAADRQLAGPDPDLAAMALASEAAVDARLADVRALRTRLLDFYEHSLDPTQQAVARELLRRRLQQVGRIGDALSELRAALAHG